MANFQIQDRVVALQGLIQENQLSFFDSLASHPERQQEAVQHLLRAHRESLEETATEQFSDIPEFARQQALDQYMHNLQRQMTSCLVVYASNQLALSPLVHIDDFQMTVFYKVVKYLQSLGYKVESSESLRQKCRESVGPHGTMIDVFKVNNSGKKTRLQRFFDYFSPSSNEEKEYFANLHCESNIMKLDMTDRKFSEEATSLANNIAHLFQIEIIVHL